MAETSNMVCPACETFQPRAETCSKCGVFIAKAKSPKHAEIVEQVASSKKKFPVAIVAVALLIIVPVISLFLISGESDETGETNEDVSTTTANTSGKESMSDIDRIAAINPAVADKILRAKVMSKLQSLKTMLYMYGLEGAEPPSNEEGLQLLVDKGHLQENQVTDEWGNMFHYRLEWGKDDGFTKEYKIFIHSKGPDGISGNGDDIQLY